MDAALEESSRVSGASAVGTLIRIIIPVMMPAILVATILGLIRSLEAFEIELVLGVPVGIQVFSTKILDLVIAEPSEYPPAMALSSTFLVVLLVLLCFQRVVVGRKEFTTVTGRGFNLRRTALGRWKNFVFVLVFLLALIVTVVPTIFLALGTFMRLFGFFDISDAWTLNNWRQVLHDPVIMRSLWNTLVVALGSAMVGVYSLIAYVIVKTSFTFRGVLDFLSCIPWSIPGLLLGIALPSPFLGCRLLILRYGSVYMWIIAIIIKNMPKGTQVIKCFMLTLGREWEGACIVWGASWFSSYRRILVRLLFPALVTVGLLV